MNDDDACHGPCCCHRHGEPRRLAWYWPLVLMWCVVILAVLSGIYLLLRDPQ